MNTIASQRSELMDLLDTPLEAHRRRIADRHPPEEEILNGKRSLALYPAARMATKAAKELRDRGGKVVAFSDKDPGKWGGTIDGIAIVAPSELRNMSDQPAVLICSTLHDSSIREYLEELGCEVIYSTPYLNYCFPDIFVSREYFQATASPYRAGTRAAILRLFDLLEDEESRNVLAKKVHYYLTLEKSHLDEIRSARPIYFDNQIVPMRGDHIVVDAGAFNGDTLQQFRKLTANEFRRYHAFEPDPIAYANLLKEASHHNRVEVICAGLSKENGTVRFSSTGSADGTIATEGDEKASRINVVSLDSYFADWEAPTLIKMDIEGSESDALRGARALLANHRPILAVSVYHYPSDLWEIPILMAELTSDYRFYLRHYTREIDDTVCYAVPQ